MNFSSFYSGLEFEAYKFLGAHVGENGTVFRVFAPSAKEISVIGDFNNWNSTPMAKIYDGNFWECTIPNAEAGMMYKYRITGRDGRTIDHCDPYAFYSEKRPNTASIIWTLDSAEDGAIFERDVGLDKPVNIYEMHFGSWRRKSDAPEDWFSYREMPELLIPYLKEHGYNYLELMPLGEYPSDESWGYQATGFFSPTSRYGNPDDLRFFIGECHKNGIGVIIDFVPVHFAVDDYSLGDFDGTALYEYPHVDVGRSEWGSRNFMHSRGEVRSFLQSSALYWLNEFGFDGLRMDAVSNLIYWQGDSGRGENRDAINFLRTMNSGLKERVPGVMLIAEDSSQYDGVTRPVSAGGLGFDYKWDLGWMHDTLDYFKSAPEYRTRDYHKLTFSMMYFRNEHYLLPLSHDEVVHGKATILQKMNGDLDVKFSQGKALYLYMMAHPGKKLNFMGNEFGQLREWDESREQDWLLLKYPSHDSFLRFITDLNRLYLTDPAMYENDYEESGFKWLECGRESDCVYAFERTADDSRLVIALNLSDKAQEYILDDKTLEPLLYTDWEKYGGTSKESEPAQDDSGAIVLAPFSGVCFKQAQSQEDILS